MHWFPDKLTPSQPRSRRSRRRHAHRKMVFPERLEPRNAPGVMLPFLPVLDPLAEETAVVDEVDQFDPHEAARGLSPEFDTGQESASPRARDQAFAELGDRPVDDVVDEVATTKVEPLAEDRRLAVGFVFDQLGTPSNVVAELITLQASLPTALTEPVVVDSPPPPPVAPEPTPAPAAVVASSPVAAAAPEVGSSTTHVPHTPPPASPPSAPSLPVAEQATAAAETTERVPPPTSAPAAVAPPTPVAKPAQTAAAALVAVVEVIAPPAPPVATTVVEPQSTTEIVSNSVAAVLASFEDDSSLTTTAIAEQLSAADVDMLLSRAAKATNSNDAIIAIVDRGGHILGVHVEQGVVDTIVDMDTRVFAIDGAVAKARTAAFFSNNQAPLTSRTVRFISQSTVTEREVRSNPNETVDDTLRGPGFVAPIGLGGHFPPDVLHTPHVDLFAIEHTNRDSLVHPGVNRIKEAAAVDADGNIIAAGGDDIFLGSRFGANFLAGQEIDPPESYGVVSGLLTSAQSRGIGTLPGGVPIYKLNPMTGSPELAGGIGVFFPGPDGFADFEQGFVAGIGQTTGERTNANRVLEAEYIAGLVAANTTTIGGMAPVADLSLPMGRIDLVGITLESLGPHPGRPDQFLTLMGRKFVEGPETGTRMPVTPAPGAALAIAGTALPSGWLVNPVASADGLISAAEVQKVILDGVNEANLVRSAIRLPLGTRSRMVLAVADKEGEILGLFRMPDSTFFSIDVAVAKARNVVYYADPADLLSIDQIDVNGDTIPDVAAGVAFTNRTFRFLAEARFPSGVDGSTPAPFSILSDPGIDPLTGENLGAPTAATAFTSVLGFDAFNPSSNFREPVPTTGFQNGIVFFPGSSPLFNNTTLIAGFGVSGDGVDQDDVVTFSGAGGFLPRRGTGVTRADEVFVDGVRLPYQKFLRNPRG